MPLKLQVSIHDVMPETLSRVSRLIERLDFYPAAALQLLVVPGKHWREQDLHQLRCWVDQGYTLAGHGWSHHAPTIESRYHRFHSKFLSSDAAEHLCLDELSINQLLNRNYCWFETHDLPAPTLYVPPAWALGSISPESLLNHGFTVIETLTGYRQVRSDRFIRVPVIGYEAINRMRAVGLGASNLVNRNLGRLSQSLRIAYHPYDQELLLKRQLEKDLQRLAGRDYIAVSPETFFSAQSTQCRSIARETADRVV